MEKDDVFDVQSNISAEVAKKIGSEYGLINKKNTLLLLEGENVDLSDYMLMLKYYYYQTLLSEELWVELLNSVEKALTNRPNSAILWAMKANLYGDIYAFDMPGEEEAYKNLGEFAEKACSLNPDNIFVRVAVAFKCFMYGEKERFYNICDETISRISNSSFRLSAFAMFLCLFGEWVKGKELLDLVFENNIEVPKIGRASCRERV